MPLSLWTLSRKSGENPTVRSKETGDAEGPVPGAVSAPRLRPEVCPGHHRVLPAPSPPKPSFPVIHRNYFGDRKTKRERGLGGTGGGVQAGRHLERRQTENLHRRFRAPEPARHRQRTGQGARSRSGTRGAGRQGVPPALAGDAEGLAELGSGVGSFLRGPAGTRGLQAEQTGNAREDLQVFSATAAPGDPGT